ncbi:FCD domain-containing protein [Streptomyces sp. NBC_01549]|uniref:FCD domain-containing protein n=1 Tax=Streptomyces sp. NBC_01549 TaxID=2975874 RepID=UPI0022536C57|nr:FCD domain-containing protein [Streptomyces sp. NBC_01549]MCX4594739.1 FCD domain-containing protein [Streptomyces sp. NBC_01549]
MSRPTVWALKEQPDFAIGVGQTRHSSGPASRVAFHNVIMQASGNHNARGVVRAPESQVVDTARCMGRPERAVCVASNRGHRRVCERIAAHDPSGATEAMFTHITEAWIVRRSAPGDPVRLGLVSVARPRAPSPYER